MGRRSDWSADDARWFCSCRIITWFVSCYFHAVLASAIVTSVGGSILLVEATRNLITLVWSQQTMISISSTVLLITIVGIALAGLGLQLTLDKRKPKTTE